MSISCSGIYRPQMKPAWPNEMKRRDFLCRGGALAAALPLSPALASSDTAIEITMTGRPDGSKVWFDPYGVLIRPGQTVRWINRDKANSHTATAYAPVNDEHLLRIPRKSGAIR